MNTGRQQASSTAEVWSGRLAPRSAAPRSAQRRPLLLWHTASALAAMQLELAEPASSSAARPALPPAKQPQPYGLSAARNRYEKTACRIQPPTKGIVPRNACDAMGDRARHLAGFPEPNACYRVPMLCAATCMHTHGRIAGGPERVSFLQNP